MYSNLECRTDKNQNLLLFDRNGYLHFYFARGLFLDFGLLLEMLCVWMMGKNEGKEKPAC